MTLQSQLESILFVASKPLAAKKMAKILNTSEREVSEILEQLKSKYSMAESGITLLQNNDEWQLTSNPANKTVAEQFMKAEVTGELTRPQLETLTVVSYCGPITKPELEQIRGVNCSLILRNLMMRGLVKEADGSTDLLPSYEVTMEYARHLGIQSVSDLPEYAELHNHDFVTKALEQKSQA